MKAILSCTIIIFVFVLTGCATKERISVKNLSNDVAYTTRDSHDTVMVNTHDSIYHTIFQKGDTIYDTKYVERIVYRNVVVKETDTVYQDRFITKTEEKETERIITPKWCYYSLSLLIVFACFFLAKIILKLMSSNIWNRKT